MGSRAFFIGSTGQHVGKTTVSLGLVSGLRKRFKKVGFLKPIGQEHLSTKDGVLVDKDVILFKDYFHLEDPYELMSPVLFSQGFTKDYLDGKIQTTHLRECLKVCYEHLREHNDCLVMEGTGHVGVGSIADLNNAQVAALCGVKMLIVASGGIGSSFDAIALNKQMCDHYGVKIAGVILNKVLPEKKEMVLNYMQKGLSRWNIPIIGCIPYDAFLTNPTMADYASIFNAKLLSGESHHLRHFEHIRFVATSLEMYKTLIRPSQLIITPASRSDVILTTLEHKEALFSGMILTGVVPPEDSIVEALKKADVPAFYAKMHTFETMKLISSYTSKLKEEDVLRVQEAISLVEGSIDFDRLLQETDLT